MSATILLVDPVPAYRSSVASRLKEAGHEVLEADNEAAATEAARNGSVDIAFVDNSLPDGIGLDLLPELQKVNKDVHFVLIVEPSFDVDSSEEFCQHKGISRLVRGPAHPNMICQLAEDLLSGKESKQEGGFVKDETRELRNSRFEIDEKADTHLIAVRRSYQEKLPKELDKLEQALEEARRNPDDIDALREAYRLSHSLHGTAGTLGFAEVSESAAAIEEAVKLILGGAPPKESMWEEIFEDLRRAATAPERASLLEITKAGVSGIATVLVVDGDPEMLASVEVMARKNLITVVSALNRDEALDHARRSKLDGAIIDIHVGGRDKSIELIQELRSMEGLGDLPIAIMSADSSILNRVAATHAGASQFLQKPLSPEEFVEAVRFFGTVRTELGSKVLIVDDDEHFRAHVAGLLKAEGMDVTQLGEPERILEVIENVKPELLLLDVVMPKISGFDICRLLRSTTAWKDVPILFLTAESDPEVRLECFRAGGDDYIEKPVIREELSARIGVRLERIRLFKERADRDGLTNLPNRRAFLDMFKIRIAEGRRYDRPLSLCLIDLDKFKHINDTYGHLAGDRVLVGLGKLLGERFRTVDIRGRWGGEEFAVVFYGEEAPTAQMVLGRVLDELKQLVFEGDHGERFHVTFSCGIATFPSDGTTFDDLFRTADEKLYVAKKAGRCRIEI